jgi:hypothetical protein
VTKELNKEWLNWHAADIVRIKVLMKFGGIYLDQDMYVVKSLDTFRKFEITVHWIDKFDMAPGILIANQNARFLKLYLKSYRKYNSSDWDYNCCILPVESILSKYPYLVHRVEVEFGTHSPTVCPKLYSVYYPNCINEYYTIHLFMRDHNVTLLGCTDWDFGYKYPPVMTFDEENIKTLNVTFGEMARLVLYGAKTKIKDEL